MKRMNRSRFGQVVGTIGTVLGALAWTVQPALADSVDSITVECQGIPGGNPAPYLHITVAYTAATSTTTKLSSYFQYGSGWYFIDSATVDNSTGSSPLVHDVYARNGLFKLHVDILNTSTNAVVTSDEIFFTYPDDC